MCVCFFIFSIFVAVVVIGFDTNSHADFVCTSSRNTLHLIYSTNLCHSAICRRGELHTSFQWFNADPPHLGPPISNRPITYLALDYLQRIHVYNEKKFLRDLIASILTSFLVTRSQSSSINSNEMPSKHAPEPCNFNLFCYFTIMSVAFSVTTCVVKVMQCDNNYLIGWNVKCKTLIIYWA